MNDPDRSAATARTTLGALAPLVEQAPMAMAVLAGPDHVFIFANAAFGGMTGRCDLLGRGIREAFPELAGQGIEELLDHVYVTGTPSQGREIPLRLRRDDVSEEGFHDFTCQPLCGVDGQVEAVAVYGIGASERAGEAALRASEERVRLALDAAAMGSFVWYPVEDRGEPDARMLALFGLPPDGTLDLAVALATLIHSDDRVRYAAAVTRATDPGGDGELREEIRVVHPDGTERWLSVAARTAFAGEPPQALRMAGVATDITERKRREANLAFLSEVSQDLAKLTNIDETMNRLGAKIGGHFNAPLVAFAEVDDVRGTVTVTHEWVRPGLPDWNGIHVLRDYYTEELMRACRAGEPYVARDAASDSRPTTPNLTAISLQSLVSVPLLRDGEWRFQVTIADTAAQDWRDDEIELVRELTTRIWTRLERARAEEALRRSEERARALLANLPGGAAFIVDHDLRYLLAEGEALQAAEMVGAHLIGRTIFEALDPALATSYEPMYRGALAGEPFVHEHEAYGRTYLSRGVPLRDDSGAVYAALAVSYDITDRRQAEEALERTHHELERRVAERTAELAQANARLRTEATERRRAEAARTELLRRLVTAQEEERRRTAHEVHDGVTQLASAAALHLDEALSLLPELGAETRAELERARALARGAAAEARRLIAALRPETLDDFGLAGALRQEVEALHAAGWQATFEDGAGTVERLPPEVEITLYRVAQEALLNVRKHTIPTRVRVRFGRPDGRVRLEVRDWGPGFDPTAARDDSAAGERVGLTGMGERMALLGGRLEVRSGRGRGTTIRATLPRVGKG